MCIRLCPLLLAMLALFIFAAESSQAQVKPGQYRLVGAFHVWNNGGGGFYGKVRISGPGPVRVALNDGSVLRGRITSRGKYIVTSVNGLTATGSARMQARSYAVGDFKVPGLGNGVFMLGRIGN